MFIRTNYQSLSIYVIKLVSQLTSSRSLASSATCNSSSASSKSWRCSSSWPSSCFLAFASSCTYRCETIPFASVPLCPNHLPFSSCTTYILSNVIFRLHQGIPLSLEWPPLAICLIQLLLQLFQFSWERKGLGLGLSCPLLCLISLLCVALHQSMLLS